MTHADHARLGGMESSEIIMWLVGRAMLSASVKSLHRTYYLPSMTAIATMVLDNQAEPLSEREAEKARAKAKEQLAGIEDLPGTYPFDLKRSVENYTLNKFLHDLVIPAHRQAFLADPEALFEQWGLPENERAMIRERDWIGLNRHGAIFFVLEKLAAVVGTPNPAIYANFNGMSLPDFLATRNTQVTYGVGSSVNDEEVEAAR
jgi:gallate dioxygenase